MKIIKDGNADRLKDVVRFTCSKCGCAFKANKGEYGIGEQYNETYYTCECPFCHNQCSRSVYIRQ